jgi:hypothetical protein
LLPLRGGGQRHTTHSADRVVVQSNGHAEISRSCGITEESRRKSLFSCSERRNLNWPECALPLLARPAGARKHGNNLNQSGNRLPPGTSSIGRKTRKQNMQTRREEFRVLFTVAVCAPRGIYACRNQPACRHLACSRTIEVHQHLPNRKHSNLCIISDGYSSASIEAAPHGFRQWLRATRVQQRFLRGGLRILWKGSTTWSTISRQRRRRTLRFRSMIG